MNFFDSLNHGDASLKEPHLTSILYYLFKQTHLANRQNSWINFFINKFLDLPPVNDAVFDVEANLKIEQILQHQDGRKDCDITIYLDYGNEKYIVNIENKISNNAFQRGQVAEQARILSENNPGYVVKNILLMPYLQPGLELNAADIRVVYWFGDNDSLISQVNIYLSTVSNEQAVQPGIKSFYDSCIGFFTSFGEYLEQVQLSSANVERGPRNRLPDSMFNYLSHIANDWEAIFPDPEHVLVSDLLVAFDNLIGGEIRANNDDQEAERMIAKFRRGALEAQPKIVTINEKNRIHFNVTSADEKRLFYYPDYPDGEWEGRWRGVRIKPLRLMNENNEYLIYWKNPQTGEVMFAGFHV